MAMSVTPRLIVDRLLQSSAPLHTGRLEGALRDADPPLRCWDESLAGLVIEGGRHVHEIRRDRSKHRGLAMLGFAAGIALGAVSEGSSASRSLLLAASVALAAVVLSLSPIIDSGERR